MNSTFERPLVLALRYPPSLPPPLSTVYPPPSPGQPTLAVEDAECICTVPIAAAIIFALLCLFQCGVGVYVHHLWTTEVKKPNHEVARNG